MSQTSEPLLKSGELITSPYFAFMQQAVRILDGRERHVLKLEPAFYPQFSCSGCGQCCQRPWGITVSKEYAECWGPEFERHPSGAYREPFVLRSESDPNRYAELRRKPGTHECIFLTDEKRCFIHETYGEEALSRICREYPRYEGWFGAFLGQFLLGSCPDVVELAQGLPGIRYQVVVVKPEQWAHLLRIQHPMGLSEGSLWLGLQLDLIADDGLTPVQSLRALAKGLELLPAPLAATREADLEGLRPDSGSDVKLMNPPTAEAWDCLSWYLKPLSSAHGYLQDVRSGLRDWPRLSNSERQLLNDFLRRYLAFRALTANYYSPSGLNFFYPYYFQLAVHVALLQWLALSYREREGHLTQEQLVRAATLISYRFEHASEFVEKLVGRPAIVCLAGMRSMLDFDFGAAS